MTQFTRRSGQKWALITGASSGIGAALANRIAKEGYSVVLVGRREDRLNQIARSIEEQSNVDTMIIPLDLANASAPKRLLEILQSQEIKIDVFFNNAGFGANGEFCDLTIERQLEMVDLNCKTLITLSHGIANEMKNRRHGSIVHVASMGGLFPTPYYSTYGATKAFVVAFSEALAVELQPSNVRVYTLCPGATETEFEVVSEFKGRRPPKAGFETAEQVAETAVRGLGKAETLIISGRLNRIMACVMQMVPRRISLHFASNSMKPRGAA